MLSTPGGWPPDGLESIGSQEQPAYTRGFRLVWMIGGILKIDPLPDDGRSGEIDYTIAIRRSPTDGMVDAVVTFDDKADSRHASWQFDNLPLWVFEQKDFRWLLGYAARYEPRSTLRTEGARQNLALVKQFAAWALLKAEVV